MIKIVCINKTGLIYVNVGYIYYTKNLNEYKYQYDIYNKNNKFLGYSLKEYFRTEFEQRNYLIKEILK